VESEQKKLPKQVKPLESDEQTAMNNRQGPEYIEVQRPAVELLREPL